MLLFLNNVYLMAANSFKSLVLGWVVLLIDWHLVGGKMLVGSDSRESCIIQASDGFIVFCFGAITRNRPLGQSPKQVPCLPQLLSIRSWYKGFLWQNVLTP